MAFLVFGVSHAMTLSIHEVKQLIIRLYRNLDPHELDGLKKIGEGQFITKDHKWTYYVRHGGFLERQNNSAPKTISLDEILLP